MAETVISFGAFEVFPDRRLLLNSGHPVQLGSRALDILLILAAHPGEVVSKKDLIAHAWPETFVEESSLRVHVGRLRKALGDNQSTARFLTNVPGRGYCFVAPVTVKAKPRAAQQQTTSRTALGPLRLTPVFGRDDFVRATSRQLGQRRLVTLVGPGGIGKTTAAVAIGNAATTTFRDGVRFVDLAPVSDPFDVVRTVASALGVSGRLGDVSNDVVAFLADRQILILLDNCEQVIESAAALVETILADAPQVTILATSREPLRAEGEWIQRMPPLELPPLSEKLTAAEAMRYSAVQLFVERASLSLGGYELADDEAFIVADICRRLDGIALAIELASHQVAYLGLSGVAESLRSSFDVLTRGRRTALPRHRTMRATLDWSYYLLPRNEQLILRRLAVFNGCFPPDAARQVTTDHDVDFDEAFTDLVAKSLIAVDTGRKVAPCRLLDTTRAYAAEKLEEESEVARYSRRHAEYYRALFDRAKAEWETRPTVEWLDAYGPHLANLRAALQWAFTPINDPLLGVALTVAAVPFWYALSLVDECLGWVQQALAWLEKVPEQDQRRRMQLYAALGWPRMRATAGLPNGANAWETSLAIAEQLGDLDYQLRALWALWVDRNNHGQSRLSAAIADKFSALAATSSDPADAIIGDRMRGKSLLFLGDIAGACRLTQRMLERYVPPVNQSHLIRFQYDQNTEARITLAQILWLQGFPDSALREVNDMLGRARAIKHTLSLAHALADAACKIALVIGDLQAAEAHIAELREVTKAHALDVWNTYADCYAGELQIKRGDVQSGVETLRVGIDKLERGNFVLYRTAFLGALAGGYGQLGQIDAGMAEIESALAQCERTGEQFHLAELQRIRGELLLGRRAKDARQAAEAAFRQSLETANHQGALSWMLRSATNLTRLMIAEGRHVEALAVLDPVLDRFTEGFKSADFTAAAAILRQLSHTRHASA